MCVHTNKHGLLRPFKVTKEVIEDCKTRIHPYNTLNEISLYRLYLSLQLLAHDRCYDQATIRLGTKFLFIPVSVLLMIVVTTKLQSGWG